MKSTKIRSFMLVREWRRGGTRGSEYAYVLIGNELVQVSEVGKLIKHEDDEYIYELPSNVSPWIYIFSFSRSGYGFVIKCPPGDYVNPMDYMRCGSRSIEDTISDWLNGVNFRIRNPELRELLNELFSEFVTMANEVKKYWRSIGGELSFGGHAPRLVEFFNNPKVH
ncbi:MAG: hypothetical protein ACP5GZ_11450, partial [Vulcanisaeta sp.]